ncbi:hypothetical protein BofuT4_uP131830.1 [Botrytis cinerea T4]|uniref:Uncharacterized protein n=1 Tax=Botryotinia fuckeliana (strain T4) TaxID=999810 RepID=G2YQV5_BOTF4|nr:hypothetical protein BofuT4_uP131830.1 [Botrytis cinerea T4]
MAPVMAIQFDKRPKAEIWCCMRHFRVSCLNFYGPKTGAVGSERCCAQPRVPDSGKMADYS